MDRFEQLVGDQNEWKVHIYQAARTLKEIDKNLTLLEGNREGYKPLQLYGFFNKCMSPSRDVLE